jgi:hypothetical protein
MRSTDKAFDVAIGACALFAFIAWLALGCPLPVGMMP